MSYQIARSALNILAASLLFSLACGDDESGNKDASSESPAGDTGVADASASLDAGVYLDATLAADGQAADAGPGATLRRASHSTAIDISGDDRWVVMVNREEDSISVFDTSRGNARTALVQLGLDAEPSSVVIHPDGKTAFVALRGLAAVVKVTGIDTANPTVSPAAPVGSEPTGLALSPRGQRLFVAEFAEGNVAVLDSADLHQLGLITGPEHPYALAVTNDLDMDDDDELLIVPEFYGVPTAAGAGESKDDGRTGLVRIYDLKDLAAQQSITFQPIDSGFPRPTPEQPMPQTVATSPNQLGAVAVLNGRIYVTSVSASPAGAPNFNTNVQPVIYVGDLTTRMEVRDAFGSVNLAKLVAEKLAAGSGRLFLADLAGIDFVESGELIAYTVSTGADAVQRVRFAAPGATGVVIGSTANDQIDVLQKGVGGCQNPIGIVTRHGDNGTLYLNCWVSRELGVVDLAKQELAQVVEASASASSSDEAKQVDRGRRFFFTGRGRWSSEGWSSCGSCHPGGLSDNMTWGFPAGPRQTTSLDGTFSHFPGKPQKQRALNWTAIFEELHDFERNTRGVSGGLGAITTAAAGECGMLAKETPQTLPADGLGQPIKELQATAGNCTLDWDDIEAWVKTVRPPDALTRPTSSSVARGRMLFEEGGCVYCHSGAGFTVSRRFWDPSSALNDVLKTTPLVVPAQVKNPHAFQLEPEPPLVSGGQPIAPTEVACVIRNVNTFGVFSNAVATTALEVKNSGMARAQGEGGFNVPSLYGMALGAPYLHHGLAASLDELFSNPAYQNHLRAGNANFLTNDSTAAADRQSLIDFVLSIDATTTEFAIPTDLMGVSLDICPPDHFDPR